MKLYAHTDENGKEYSIRSPFWRQMREAPEISPALGFAATDLDCEFFSLNTGSFIIFEHKCRSVFPEDWQTTILNFNDLLFRRATETGSLMGMYRGCYLIQHEGESVTDDRTHVFKLINGRWFHLTCSMGYETVFTGSQVFQWMNQTLL